MTLEYNNLTSTDNSHFLITDHIDFNAHGRALCPACSPYHKNRSLTLALVPDTDGAYKCFRGCTSEEIREALGHPKKKVVPTALARPVDSTPVKNTFDEVRVVKEHAELLSLRGGALEAIRWLANRGITTDLAKKYKLGLARARSSGKMVYSITIPIETEEKGRFWIKKRVAPWDVKVTEADEYKPWSQYGIPKTVFFTHKPEQATQTWLCEGEWDAIKLGWLVSQHRDDVAVASFTCGATSVPPNNELARLPGEVVVFYDRNDKLNKQGKRPGEEGAKKVAQALGSRAKIAAVPMPENSTVKGWDVSDAINYGYQLESFERASMTAEAYEAGAENSFLAKSRKLSQVFDEAPDYVEWLVPDLFTGNELYCLAAEPRAGKSLFALGLARAISSGSSFLGRPCQQGEVVYVCKEDPDDKVKQRLLAQQWNREEMDNVLMNNDFTLDELPELIEYVKTAKPALIVFDTLSRIQKNNGRENSSEIADVLAPLQDLAQKENVCILVVHHTRKKIQEELDISDIFDSVRGSGAIRATCRGMLVLANSKVGYRLAVENGRTAVQDLSVYLEASNLTWKFRGTWQPPNVDRSQKQIVLEWFLKHQEGTIEQIHEGTSVPKRNIYEVLRRLRHENTIVKNGDRCSAIYYLPIQQIQQAESLLNRSDHLPPMDRGMDSTTEKKSINSDQSDQVCNELLHSDQIISDQERSIKSVEFKGENAANASGEKLKAIQQNSTNTNAVELNEEKSQKAIGENSIATDHYGDVTNFFSGESEESGQNPLKQQGEKSLVGVWHKREGYVRVLDERGSRLTVRRSGETRSRTIYLRGCDNRREYETHCEF